MEELHAHVAPTREILQKRDWRIFKEKLQVLVDKTGLDALGYLLAEWQKKSKNFRDDSNQHVPYRINPVWAFYQQVMSMDTSKPLPFIEQSDFYRERAKLNGKIIMDNSMASEDYIEFEFSLRYYLSHKFGEGNFL